MVRAKFITNVLQLIVIFVSVSYIFIHVRQIPCYWFRGFSFLTFYFETFFHYIWYKTLELHVI